MTALPAHVLTPDRLKLARWHAAAGRFDAMRMLCEQALAAAPGDVRVTQEVGSLLRQYGFLSPAAACFEAVRRHRPADPSGWINLAGIALERGRHAEARALYGGALQRWPDDAALQRNFLCSLSYDPDVSDADAVASASAWGDRAVAAVGGPLPRPPCRPRDAEPLRVGYVSSDFCGHTVGYLVRQVIRSHDPRRVAVFAYAHLVQDDAVTAEIRAATQFRDITALDQAALAAAIRADAIDVLVDLNGHTAGSRLAVLAARPAPVQLSWLGYFATTGLPTVDAVLLDPVHAPPETETQFVEPVLRMPHRLCYAPPTFAPDASPVPSLSRGYVTFGSFNNTAKYTPAVFALWARILHAVPDARLLLKWRTFNDAELQAEVRRAFARHGIDPARLELRGPSFHQTMLQEYADVDIALDPFPFTGGMTSLEALWMGVPVVTLPQGRVVSRQTLAFLTAMGLEELAAPEEDRYVAIAVALAQDTARRVHWRRTLRTRLQASPLGDVAGFTRSLEEALIGLHDALRG